jgi:cytochrome c-type biogenesis protein CcmE
MTINPPNKRPMHPANRRLLFVGLGGSLLMLAGILAAIGASQSAAFFQTPSEVLEAPPAEGRAVRVGGVVVPGSVDSDDGVLTFRLADDIDQISIRFSGAIPSLFREGQCVIAEGPLVGSAVKANRLLAKHDEEYTPPELVENTRLARSCGPQITNPVLAG